MDHVREFIDQIIDSPMRFPIVVQVFGKPETAIAVILQARRLGYVSVIMDGTDVPTWKIEEAERTKQFGKCSDWIISATDEGAEAWWG
ncbi:MAG: hypothetical protein H6810_04420 [Phycisphaeraceae bacterium]|nr:MAG: hypothetical protein H6810_04420 [Phycisphaeraceae bacterium]